MKKADPNSFKKPHSFPIFDENSVLGQQLVMRMLFKPHTNTLWAFNKFWCPKEHFLDRHRAKSSHRVHDAKHLVPIYLQQNQTEVVLETETPDLRQQNEQVKKLQMAQPPMKLAKNIGSQREVNTSRPYK